MGKPKRVFEAICCEVQNFFALDSELFLPVFTGIFIIVLRILKKGLAAFCVSNLLYLHKREKSLWRSVGRGPRTAPHPRQAPRHNERGTVHGRG